jgi:hypothetical protein
MLGGALGAGAVYGCAGLFLPPRQMTYQQAVKELPFHTISLTLCGLLGKHLLSKINLDSGNMSYPEAATAYFIGSAALFTTWYCAKASKYIGP